jgi:hypothetical protein
MRILMRRFVLPSLLAVLTLGLAIACNDQRGSGVPTTTEKITEPPKTSGSFAPPLPKK